VLALAIRLKVNLILSLILIVIVIVTVIELNNIPAQWSQYQYETGLISQCDECGNNNIKI